MANFDSRFDWRRTRVEVGVASGVVAGQPKKRCVVDEMVNLTITPFARTIRRIKKKCVSIFTEFVFCRS